MPANVCPFGELRCPFGELRCPLGELRCPFEELRCPLGELMCPLLDPLLAFSVVEARWPLPTWGPDTLSMVIAVITLKQYSILYILETSYLDISSWKYEFRYSPFGQCSLYILIGSDSFCNGTPTNIVSSPTTFHSVVTRSNSFCKNTFNISISG